MRRSNPALLGGCPGTPTLVGELLARERGRAEKRAMAENLRKLVSSESLRSMQDKLELWLREYNKNSCDQNLTLCLEFIEQVAKVQGQLFGILTAIAQEGGRYDSVEVIKSRLLPWLEASFTASPLGRPITGKAPSAQDTFDKEKQKEPGIRTWAVQQLVSELNSAPDQVNQVQDELAETEKTLEEIKSRSTMSLLAAEEEINHLRNQLKTLQAQEEARNRNSEQRGLARKNTEQRGAEPRSLDQRSSELRNLDPRSWELRSQDQRSSEPRRLEQRSLEPMSLDQRSSELRSQDQRSSEPRRLEQRSLEPMSLDQRSSELRSQDQRSSEPRRLEQRSLEPMSPEQGSLEPRRLEQRSLEPRSLDQRSSELRSQERSSESRRLEQRSLEPRSLEQGSLEPRSLEQRSLEPRSLEQRSLEPRSSEQRNLEPRSPDQRSLEPRSSEHRSPEPRRWEQRRSEQRDSDKQKAEEIRNYEKQLRMLKDEIAALCAEKSALQGRSTRSRSPSPAPRSRSHSHSHSRSHSRSRSPRHSRPGSPSTAMVKIRTPSPNRARLSSVARKAALLSRFNSAYSQARLDAQCLLRRCINEAETVQQIIYIATVEAFHVAKMAFRHFQTRVKKSLTPSHGGSNDFEDAVLDYTICHLDLYDSQSSVNDVVRAMNINPKISFPPEVDFCLLSNFIQEICCIAFAMQTLEPPLDIAFGADGEIFNDSMYRRSYDSDFSAPLVFYHVWPALMENDIVIMKGEAVTKRGAFVRMPCVVTIHPKCLIHKFENIYKPRDSIKEVHKELFVKISYKGEERG